MTFYAILSEADCIEVFPDEDLRDKVLCWYYDIEFECKGLDIKQDTLEELKAWVEKEYTGIELVFPTPKSLNYNLGIMNSERGLMKLMKLWNG